MIEIYQNYKSEIAVGIVELSIRTITLYNIYYDVIIYEGLAHCAVPML